VLTSGCSSPASAEITIRKLLYKSYRGASFLLCLPHIYRFSLVMLSLEIVSAGDAGLPDGVSRPQDMERQARKSTVSPTPFTPGHTAVDRGPERPLGSG
jgi:hypothetical protein